MIIYFRNIILFFTLSFNAAFALESDQYLAWRKELKDVSTDINAYMNAQILQVVRMANNDNEHLYTCNDLRKKSLDVFRGFIVQKIEKWIEHNLGTEMLPDANTSNRKYYNMSIYYFKYSGVARILPMGHNLQMNNIYFGADKLAHFLSTGMRYFNVYNKYIEKGYSENDALRKAIDFGIRLERTVLGYWPSGVFSFGDLEANYQGLLFYRNLCEGSNPYLIRDGNMWKVKNEVDLRDYIGPYWDETFNLSHFNFFKWFKVKRNLKNYCKIKDSELVVKRMSYYKSVAQESFSVKYLNDLRTKKDKRIPHPEKRSLDTVCP